MKGKIADTITVRYGHWTTTICRKQQPSPAPEQPEYNSSPRHSDIPARD